MWNELVTSVVFTDVKIGILIYNTLQVVPTILCYVYSYIVLICLLPCALLGHILYISQYIHVDQDQMNCA